MLLVRNRRTAARQLRQWRQAGFKPTIVERGHEWVLRIAGHAGWRLALVPALAT